MISLSFLDASRFESQSESRITEVFLASVRKGPVDLLIAMTEGVTAQVSNA